MSTITIKNVGPVKNVSINLNKINIIMGPQSSGKSTIAKVISYCLWMEKDITVNQAYSEYPKVDSFRDKLETFHKLRGYITVDSEITYHSDVLELSFKGNSDAQVRWNDKFRYLRSKISYIPAERNLVILPEIEKLELPNNNIRSFMFDWFDARKPYHKAENISLLNLGVNYYYDADARENRVESAIEKYDIPLANASSGLQSVVPMIIMLEYLSRWIYTNELYLSFEAKERRNLIMDNLSKIAALASYSLQLFQSKKERYNLYNELQDGKTKGEKELTGKDNLLDIIQEKLFDPHFTQFIIEEPEQNLFPDAQKELMYYLVSKISDKERDHKLLLTTHSPYILYAINNCMLGYLVKDKLPVEKKEEIQKRMPLIDPRLVSIWEVEDGFLRNIQGEDGLIGKNYFDGSMKNVMDEFYTLINYYGDEE